MDQARSSMIINEEDLELRLGFAGLAYHGKVADVWALGVTLYCMVLGGYPFIGETLQDTYDKIVYDPLSLPEDMNPELANLLQGLLCKDPNKRMSLDAAARHPWVLKGPESFKNHSGTSTSIGMIIPSTHRIGRHDHNTNSSNDTIDLTIPNDECELIGSTISKKTRPAPSVGSKEIKLACAICMDTMQEETSTICGHIFCKKCIMSAIRAQKKCPTCRRKLTNSNIHRIYLSGSTS